MERVPMTPQGHQALKEELKRLIGTERIKISKEIEVAREHGDLRENAEYHAAKEKQGMIEARIAEIEDRLARAEVIDTSHMSDDKVRFGARVSMEEVETGKEVQYRIVGADEADIGQGLISVTSPVAQALVGKQVGDEVRVMAPGGAKVYEILDVCWQ